MSKTLPAPQLCAPTIACGTGVPAANEGSEPVAEKVLEPRFIGAPRQAVPRRRVRSNLGEPAGIFVWERDFLMAIAADVLNELVKEADEGEE